MMCVCVRVGGGGGVTVTLLLEEVLRSEVNFIGSTFPLCPQRIAIHGLYVFCNLAVETYGGGDLGLISCCKMGLIASKWLLYVVSTY